MEGHENAKEAKKKLQEYKAKMVAEVNEESQELMKRALEEVRNSSSKCRSATFRVKCRTTFNFQIM